MSDAVGVVKEGKLTLSLELNLGGSFFWQENLLAEALNQLGVAGTKAILESFDTNGEAIEVSGVKHTCKKKV